MSLPVVRGVALDRRDWPEFTWNADLVEFEGPLISLYKTDQDADALFIWLDKSGLTNRWCVLNVDREPLRLYLTCKKTLKELFFLRESVLMFGVGSAGRRTNLMRVSISNLPQQYCPRDDSYLYEEISTESAKELVVEGTEPRALLLDEDLYLEDITTIPRVVLQLYSFHYGLAYSYRDAVRQKMAQIMEKWRGGINAVNVFSGLRSVIPSVHRPRVLKIQYESPGEIRLDLLPSLFDDVHQSISRLKMDDVYDGLEAIYSDAYAYFRQEKLSGFDDFDSRKAASLTAAQKGALQGLIDRFFDAMSWSVHKSGFDALDPDPLSKLRILLAYYRRLRLLRPLLEQGKLSLPKRIRVAAT